MVTKIILFLIVAYIVLSLSGCATGQQTDRPYQELGRSKHFDLTADGLIIGFEKRSVVGSKNRKELMGDYAHQPLYSHLVEPLSGDERITQVRNALFQNYTRQNTKVMLPTQIVSRINGVQKFEYNAYDENPDGDYSYTESFQQLSKLFESLKRIGTIRDNYTHVFVLNMGWNNDQTESMWRYNLIIENLKDQAKKEKPEFKPFVIAITWPSVWRSISDFIPTKKFFHIISYPNKTQDADELGITWLNWIINDQLPGVMDNSDTSGQKLILIGHSLGARILSRALFSSRHLVNAKNADPVDLMIGLQAAFSARRFVASGGLEGQPYSEFTDKKAKLLFTTSVHDNANPIANYVTGAKHLGGRFGLAFAKKHADGPHKPGAKPVYKIVNWADDSKKKPVYDNKVLLVDASGIVVGSEKPKTDAHNDILDKKMAELMWHYIKDL
jgi:hypothetical protein